MIDYRNKLYYLILATPLVTEYIENGSYPISVRDCITDVSMVVIIAVLLKVLDSQQRQIKLSSRVDELTGLSNQRVFLEDLAREVARAHRYRFPLSIAYIDVDSFHTINQKFGHAEGDLVLKRLAIQFKNTVREEVDMCYRLEADKFIIIFQNTAEEDANIVAQRVQNAAFKSPCELRKYGSKLSVVVLQLKDGEIPNLYIDRASSEMYSSKQSLKD